MKQKTEFMRVEKTKNYSVISNEFIRRKDLSWKAKGILTYILTLPDDWVINLKEIMTHATEGESAFRSGWKELTEAGYVTRKPVRDGQRIKYWETIIRESPDMTTNSLHGDFQHVDNLYVENLDVDNHKLLSTNNTKDLTKQSTNNTNKQMSNKLPEKDLKEDFDSIWKEYPNKKGKARAFTAYKKAIKDGVDNQTIINGIRAYKKEIEIKRTEPEYIKHGANWFRDWNWEDDYQTKGKVINSAFAQEAPTTADNIEVSDEEERMYQEYLRKQGKA